VGSFFFPVFALDISPDLKHGYEPLPSIFPVVNLDVLHEPCEVISPHLLCEHAQWSDRLNGGLVALSTQNSTFVSKSVLSREAERFLQAAVAIVLAGWFLQRDVAG
jgi:hypothetical protein